MNKKAWKTPFQMMLVFSLVLSLLAPMAPVSRAEEVLTVADAIAKNKAAAPGDKGTVDGYIVAHTTGPKSVNSAAPFGNDFNVAIADSLNEQDITKMVSVQLPATFRPAFGLQTNPLNIGKKIKVSGELINYNGMPGVKNATALTFSGGDATPPPSPEKKTISEARTATGKLVEVTGTVTGIFTSGGQNNVFIQDGTAGIIVRGTSLDAKVKVGDEIKASGTVSEYFGMSQLAVANANEVNVVTENKGVPAAQLVTSKDLKEEVEGELVTIKNVTVGTKDTNGNFASTDSAGNFSMKPADATLLESGKTYDSITGVVDYNFSEYKIVPRNAADVLQDASKVQSITADPAAGFVQPGTDVSLRTLTEGSTIYYTTDGTVPTVSSTKYTGSIQVTKDMTIKAIAVKDGLKNSDEASFEYKIQNGAVRIHDIQGAGHVSPYIDKNVTDIEGVVTHVVDANNFYMQDLQPDNNEKTAEGILVYKKGHGMTSGDVVKASGQVKEYVLEGYSEKATTDLSMTEISTSTLTKVSSGAVLPQAVVIGKDRIAPTQIIDNDQLSSFDPEQDGIDFYESLEGMLVGVENAKIVAPQAYGELVVVPGTVPTNTTNGGMRVTAEDFNPERITVDINDEKFLAKSGDSFKGMIQGVVSYGFSNFKILTNKANLPEFVEGSTAREITSLIKDEKQLTVASYNVENFSAADNDEKVTKLARAIVTNLKQPDIVGLTEMQDNDGPADTGTTAADQSFKKLIDKIKALGGPDYSYTDIAPENNKDGGQPGGNIRVGFLYNKDRVSMTEGTKGTATQAVGFENEKLTLNPGRIDPTNTAFGSSRKPLAAQFEFKGKKVIIIANHFNSKGGDQPLFGKNQPPVLKSEEQRHKIAGIVNNFVKDVKTKDPDANMIVLGDFNDFEFSKTFDILKGSELSNMVEKVPAEKRFSYVYQGNSQVLDHMLVSNNLTASTNVDIVHINSSFMEEQGRASDHDPVVIQTDLNGKSEMPYNKIYKLKGFKTKKLTVEAFNSYIEMDAASIISDSIVLKNKTALNGDGLKTTKIVITPSVKDTTIDFKGSEVKEVVISNLNVNKIYGAESVKNWTVSQGLDSSKITFYHSNGTIMPSPVIMNPAS